MMGMDTVTSVSACSSVCVCLGVGEGMGVNDPGVLAIVLMF